MAPAKEIVLQECREWLSHVRDIGDPIISDISEQIPHDQVLIKGKPLGDEGRAYFWAKIDNQAQHTTDFIRTQLNVPEPYNNLLVGTWFFVVRMYGLKYMPY